MKKITEEQIIEIINLLNQRKNIQVKKILNELEEFTEDNLREELRKFLMNKGKSTIFTSELWNLLDETKDKV